MSGAPCVIVGGRPWVDAPARALCARLGWAYWREPVPAATLKDTAYAFFVHCSERVPKDVLEATVCIGFHMTKLPEGRGGSPLQHLILAGKDYTVLTAFGMTEEMDAGPIYCREALSLAGSAEQIYARATRQALAMAERIADLRLLPHSQVGTPTVTKRRTPAESALPETGSLDEIYDRVRMVDAEGYPLAFIDHGDFRMEFRRAGRYVGRVECDVVIRRRDGKDF